MSLEARCTPSEIRLRTSDAVATGRRRLLPEERTELVRRGTRSAVAGGALLLPVPLLFVTCVGALVLLSGPDGEIAGGALGVMVLMLVGLPLMVVQGHQWYRRGMGMRRDARRGEVLLFARESRGSAAEEVPPEPAWFEVLPGSRLVWRTDQGLPAADETVDFVGVAEPPASAATAAQWTEPLDPFNAPGVQVNHRGMTPAERAELVKHLRSTALAPLCTAVPFTLWSGAVLSFCLTSGRWPSGHDLVGFIGLLGVTVLLDVLAIAGLRTGWMLRRDHQAGRVVIVRLARAGGGALNHSLREDLSPPSEVLPFSQRIWTDAGKPAPWRAQ